MNSTNSSNRTVSPDGVVGFDGESYDPSAESGHFTCPRCGWATGWAGGGVDDFDDDPVREHMDRHADEDAKAAAAGVCGDCDGRGVTDPPLGSDALLDDPSYVCATCGGAGGVDAAPTDAAPAAAPGRTFRRGDRVRYTQAVQRDHGPAIDSRGTVTRVVDSLDDPPRPVVWVEMDGDPTLVEAFYAHELAHVEPDPADQPIPYTLVDEVPGVERDPAFVPSTTASSSMPGLDGIRHGVGAPAPAAPAEPAEAAWDRGETAGIVEGLRQAARVVEARKARIKDRDPVAGEALAALDDVVVELLDLAAKGGAA